MVYGPEMFEPVMAARLNKKPATMAGFLLPLNNMG